MKHFVYFFLLAMISGSLSSCQKVVFDDEEEGGGTNDAVSLRFRVTQFEQVPFDKADATRATDVGKTCTRLNFAVYQNGERVKQLNQLSGDASFGTFNLSLKPGRYLAVALAHSSDENPTMTNPSKIPFTGVNKMTDTFWYGDTIVVDNDSAYQIKLKRAVAMFRLQATDTVPKGVKLVRFYFTGGSSTFDAVKGFGCVESKQTASFEITNDMIGRRMSFDAYTFPKADNKGLNMKITTHDAGANVLVEENLSNVPIERNVITLYKGRLFNRNAGSKGDFNLDFSSDDEWKVNEYPF